MALYVTTAYMLCCSTSTSMATLLADAGAGILHPSLPCCLSQTQLKSMPFITSTSLESQACPLLSAEVKGGRSERVAFRCPNPAQERGCSPLQQGPNHKLTLAGSAKGFRQVTKELPSCPRMAVSTVGSITSGRRPVPLQAYSQVPSMALYRVTVPCSTVPAEDAWGSQRSS